MNRRRGVDALEGRQGVAEVEGGVFGGRVQDVRQQVPDVEVVRERVEVHRLAVADQLCKTFLCPCLCLCLFVCLFVCE